MAQKKRLLGELQGGFTLHALRGIQKACDQWLGANRNQQVSRGDRVSVFVLFTLCGDVIEYVESRGQTTAAHQAAESEIRTPLEAAINLIGSSDENAIVQALDEVIAASGRLNARSP